jgi:hypothetical protein
MHVFDFACRIHTYSCLEGVCTYMYTSRTPVDSRGICAECKLIHIEAHTHVNRFDSVYIYLNLWEKLNTTIYS